jgi:hypothetical protein
VKAGKPPFELLPPCRQQEMQLTSLRHSGARLDRVGTHRVRGARLVHGGEIVSLDDEDLVRVIAENAGGHQSGDAAAQHYSPAEQRFPVVQGNQSDPPLICGVSMLASGL